MRILIHSAATGLLLILLSMSAGADCDYYSGEAADRYSSASSSPGLTAAQAEAYGAAPTAVAADFAVREPAPSQAERAFRGAMTKLWEDHIVWTRNFIVAAASDSPSLDAVTNRLLQNQLDLGNAIKPYYGAAAGNQLATLLTEHITIAAEIVTAAKAGDNATMGAANQRWFANSDQIAAFLARANPQAWPEAQMRQMMREHLTLTTQQAKAELSGDWAGSIAAYDQVHTQILHMADGLASGIVAQFPDKF